MILPAIDRFHNNYKKMKNGCWIWQKANNRGYGKLAYNKTNYYAHRFSYQTFNGVIPEGFWVLHKCDTPSCVNPDHLFVGEPAENTRDCSKKGRSKNQNTGKKFCKNGHLLTIENVSLVGPKKKNRLCKICSKAYQHEHYLRYKERKNKLRKINRKRKK